MFNPHHPEANESHRAISDHLERNGAQGSFMTALCTAVFKADGDNYARLRLGFPDLVAAHQDWFNGRGPFEDAVSKRPVSSLN